MKTKLALLLAITFFGLRAWNLSAQSEADAVPRYRLVRVVEASILQEKINEAASDGYRLAGVAPASGGTAVAVLERTSSSHETYGYLLLSGKGDAALQQALNDAGAKGFRLISRDRALDWRAPVALQLRTVLAWMEKAPDQAKKFEYAVIPFGAKMALKVSLNPKLWADVNPLDYVKPEIAREQQQGFHLVRIVSGVALIMEKSEGPDTEEATQRKISPGTRQSQAYRSLKSLKGSKLERKLREAADNGYCVVDIDPQAPPMWPSILLDKIGTGSPDGAREPCAYKVIQRPDLREDDFNQSGDGGFHLVPQSVNFYGGFQTAQSGQPKFDAIFEKTGAASQAYHYRSVSASQLPELSGKLERAASEGYRAVKVDSMKDGAILVIMQKSEELARK